MRRPGVQTRPDPFPQGFLPLIGDHFIWFGDHCSGILARRSIIEEFFFQDFSYS